MMTSADNTPVTPAAVPTLAEQIMPLLVAHCPGIQCKMVGACCHTRCHAVAPLAAAAAEARPLRAFRAAIAAAAVAYHAGTGRVGGMTLPDVAFAQAVQDALDAPQGGAPARVDAAQEGGEHGGA